MNAIDAIKEALESLEYDADWEAKKDYGVRSAMSILRQALADTGIDRGAWSDVPDATKWVDDLRGGDEEWTPEDMSHRPSGLSIEEPPNSTKPVGEIVEAHGLIAVSIPEMPPVGTKLYIKEEMMDRQCPSCGGFCKSGCERENIKPKKDWIGLTDEDLEEVIPAIATYTDLAKSLYRSIAKAIEAKLRSKNT